MNRTYFAYTRVSTVKQGERGVSLIEQKSAIEAYAAKNGLTIGKWFEEMETAAKQGRRAFSQMLAGLREGKARGMIIHKIDRSARNLRDWADIADLLDRGVDVRFVNDNFDLASTGGRLSADIIAAVSASYIRNLREEVKKGMYGRLKQGLYPWQAQWGYLDQGGGRVKTVDPLNGPLVRHMFERYGTNTTSLRALRHEMYATGLRTKSGKPLSLTTVSIILRNPFYCGVLKVRKNENSYPGLHESLVSKALFDRVQAIMDGKTVPKAKKHSFLFQQMVRCANCNRRVLTGELQKGIIYYRCHNEGCRGISWRQSELEDSVLAEVRRIRLDFGGDGDEGTSKEGGASLEASDLRQIAEYLYGDRKAERGRWRDSLGLRLNQVDSRITKLTDLLIDDTIDGGTFAARKQQFLMERRNLEQELAGLDERTPFESLLDEFELINHKLFGYESMTPDEKRELLGMICSNFTASRDSLVFTLHSPYRELVDEGNPRYCALDRDGVRIHIVRILKEVAERQMEERTTSRPHVPSSPRRHPPETGAALQ